MDIQITKNNLTNLMDTFNQKQLNQIIDVLQKEHSKMNIFIDDLRRSECFKNIPDPMKQHYNSYVQKCQDEADELEQIIDQVGDQLNKLNEVK
jgi:prefoldin subunit 5|tara:strand:+ start:441 stop:719 length:279 start_codon:yes stop_codon:yes gene_type:complete